MIRYGDRRRELGWKTDENTGREPDGGAFEQGVLSLIGGVLGEPIDAGKARRSFADLGLGSLLAVRLIEAVNKAYGLELGVATVFAHPNPLALVRHLKTLVTAPPIADPAPADTRPVVAGSGSAGSGAAGSGAMAVIGLSGGFGSAPSLAAFQAALTDGQSLVAPLSAERRRLVHPLLKDGGEPPPGGFLSGIEQFDAALFGLSPREANAMDPQQRLFLERAYLALENAGYPAPRISGAKVGVYVGASPSGYERLIASDGGAGDAWGMTGNLTALLASRISYHLDLGGPALTVDTACSSSLVALDLAAQGLARGDCEMAVVGGVGLFLDPEGLSLMRRAGMLSAAGRCATFDAAADGIVIGEAVVAAILKPLERALADGDRIDAVLLATATNQDGRSNGITAPNSTAQSEVIRSALARAGLDADAIDLIEAHGTGTPLGDPVEIAGLAGAFEGRSADLPAIRLGSAKAALGHSSEAAGIVGLAKVVAALKAEMLPPLTGFGALNPRIDLTGKPLAVTERTEPWPRRDGHVRRAGVSSFGLAGTNAHAILAEPPVAPAPTIAKGPVVLLLSAESADLLARRARQLADWSAVRDVSLADLAGTLALRRSHHAVRAAASVGSLADALAELEKIAEGRQPEDTGDPVVTGYLAGGDDWVGAYRQRFGDPSFALDLPDQPLASEPHWAFDIDAAAPVTLHLTPEDPKVGDHRVGGQAILHAAALLDIALDRSVGGAIADISWMKPVAVGDGGVDLTVAPDGDGRIGACVDAGGPVFAFAVATDGAVVERVEVSDLLALQAAATVTVEGGVAEPAPGVWLGPSYRGFDRVSLGPDGAVGTVVIGDGVPARLRALDAAIQTAAAVAAAGDGDAARTRMPTGLGELRVHGVVPTGALHLIARRDAARSGGADTVVDVIVANGDGRGVLTLTGLVLHAIGAQAVMPPPAQTQTQTQTQTQAQAQAQDPPIRLRRLVRRDAGASAEGGIDPRPTLLVAPTDDALGDAAEAWLAAAGSAVTRCTAQQMDPAGWSRIVLRLPPDPAPDALATGARQVRAIAKAAASGEPLDLLVLSNDGAGDPVRRALMTLAEVAVGRETEAARVRLVDVAGAVPIGEVLTDPGAATGDLVTLRDGRRVEARLVDIEDAPPLKTPRRVAVIGGFGRVGRALATRMAARWKADLVLVGRAPVEGERTAFLDSLRAAGVTAHGLAVDITDPVAAETALRVARDQIGGLDLVVQALVDPVFGRLSAMPEAEMLEGLRAKTEGGLALRAAMDAIGEGRLAIVSSIGAFAGFPMAAGQAVYNAQCAFEQALADERTTVVHWGLWADPSWRADLLAQVRADGLFPMPEDAAFEIFERALALDPGEPLVAAALSAPVWRALGDSDFTDGDLGEPTGFLDDIRALAATLAGDDPERHAEVEAVANRRLVKVLREAGLLGKPGTEELPGDAVARLGALPRLSGLAGAVLDLVIAAGAATRTSEGRIAWKKGRSRKDDGLKALARHGPAAKAVADLLAVCVDALPQVLAGEVLATDLLFPGGSMERVEPIYRDQPGLEAANALVADSAAALHAGTGTLEAIEIGAGTGATAAAIRVRLGDDVSGVRYRYTDISAGFVRHGEKTHAAPWLSGAVLDIERDPVAQGFAAASFDLAVASNVLHATARIGETLAHVASLLRPGGVLLLNENVRLEAFATLTFGLLDGWWRSEDPEHRLAGGPLLDTARWRAALRRAGLDVIAELAPGDDAGGASQVVLVAVKRGAAAVTPAMPAATPAPVRRTEPSSIPVPAGNVTEAVRAVVAEALGLDAATLDNARPFADYGVDSIVSPQISETLAERFQVALRSTDLFSYATVEALAAHVESLGPALPAGDAPPSVSAPEPAALPQPAPAPAVAATRDDRIAIVGLAGRFPDAPDVETFWRNLRDGHCAIRPIDRFPIPDTFDAGTGEPTPIHARWAALLDGFDRFDPLFFQITPAEALTMDPQQRLLLEEAWHAIEDAGLPPERIAGDRTGVFVGASANSYVAPGAPSLQTIGGSMAILSARLAYLLDLKGPAFPIDTGCSSSLVALSLARDSLLAGGCDVAIAGGVGCNLLSEEILAYLSDAGMASPTGVCHAFDDRADGFVPGEGVGVMVLKRLADAERDGDRIHAVILGAGINQDGRTSGITAPSAASQTALERRVWKEAGVEADSITLVEAHGTGTRLGDPIEVAALTDAFAAGTDRKHFCAIGSVKTNIGHAMAAAGLAGMVKAVLALENRTIPQTLSFETANRHIDFEASPFTVATETRPWSVDGVPGGRRRAAVSSFGFSGTNAHVVMEEAPDVSGAAPVPGPWIFPLSAKTADALSRMVSVLADHLERLDEADLPHVAHTLALRRGHFRHRRVVVAGDSAGLISALRMDADAVLSDAPDALRLAAADYAAGRAVDFSASFPGDGWRVVSLPGYPFARERYWQPIRRGMVPERQAESGPRYSVQGAAVAITLSAADWRLDQHRVDGRPILPAAAMMELIAGAIAARDGAAPPALADLVWHRPVAVEGAGEIVLRLEVEGDGFRLLQGGETVAEGRVEGSVPAPEAPDIPGDLPTRIDGATLLAVAEARGIAYGPRFRAVSDISLDDEVAVARLDPAVAGDARCADVLDAAMQAAAGIGATPHSAQAEGAAPDGLYVPHALGRLAWFDKGRPATVHARVRRREASGAVFDISILDPAGSVLARMESLVARRMARETAPDTVLHAPRWVPATARATVELSRTVEVGSGWIGGLADLQTGAALGVVARLDPSDEGRAAVAALSRIARDLAGLAGGPRIHLTTMLATGSETPAVRAVAAAARALAVENPGWRICAVSGETVGDALPTFAASTLVEDLRLSPPDAWEQRALVPLGPVEATPPPLAAGSVVVISGGLGGLGRAIATALAGDGYRPVLLARRSDAADVPVYIADVTDGAQVEKALDRVRREVGPIGAVLHLAGTRCDGILSAADPADIEAVFSAKVDGLRNLDAATRDDPLTLFAVFGSTSAEFGAFGQGVYGAANAAAAGLVAARAADPVAPGRSLCVGWPLWAEGGMTAPGELVALLKREAGMVPLPTEAGLTALWAAADCGEPAPVALYGTGDMAAGLRRLSIPAEPAAAPVRRADDAAGYIASILAEVAAIPMERIDPDLPFEEYGIDSMMITRLNAALERDLGAVAKTLFYEYRTPGEVAAYLAAEKASELAALAGPVLAASAAPVPQRVAEPAPAPASDAANGADDGAVAIIGIAGIFPGGEDLEEFWSRIEAGTDLIREVPADRWSLDGFYDPDRENISTSHSKWGGFIDGADLFDPRFFDMAPVEAEALDPQARKMMEVAWWALEDAGYTRASLFAGDPDPGARKGGVFVGLMHNDYPLFAAEARTRGELAITAAGYWNAANRISHLLDFQGPSMAVDTACSASLTAIHSAIRALAAGDCTVAIAGGVNLSLHPMKYWVLSKAGFASSDGRCRSFGAGGDGYVPGEGAGAVILKPLARARADGDRIHAVIRASAVNHGGRTSGFTVPNPVAQGRLIANAMDRAGVEPGTVSYVEAHGTGTALGDPIEITGLKRAFGGEGGCPIGSIKSNVGHLESAAGIAAVAKVVLQMRHRTLAPSLHAGTLNPDLGISGSGFRVVTAAEPWQARPGAPLRAGISSFGAGGANVHLIVDAPDDMVRESIAPGPLAFPISARTPGSLKTVADRLATFVEAFDTPLADIAFTLAEGREAMKQRAVVVTDDRTALVAGLRRIAAGETVSAVGDWGDLCTAWLDGGTVDWRARLPAGARRTGLPLTPFERRRCWITTRPDPAFQAAPQSVLPDVIPSTDPLIADHLVEGGTVAAGALLLAEAVRSLDLSLPLALADIAWRKTVTVGATGLSVSTSRDGEEVTIAVEGEPVAGFSTAMAGAPPPAEPRPETESRIDGADLYRMLGEAGVTYGPAFARITSLAAGDGVAVADLAPPVDAARGALDARVLDAALQACAGIMQRDGAGLRPASIATLTLWRPLADARTVIVRRSGTGEPVTADITMTDDAGGVVAALDGLVLLPVRARPQGPPLRLLRPDWRAITAAPEAARIGGVLIVDPGTAGPLAGALSKRLKAAGTSVSAVDAVDGSVPDGVAEIVFLGGFGGGGEDVAARREFGTLALARLARTLAKGADHPLLRIVTDGSPEGAAVTAFAKALSREIDGLRLRLIDLPPTADPDRLAAWADSAPDAPQDTETAVRDGAWMRLALSEVPDTASDGGVVAGVVAGGRYLIAGGSGGIGRALGRHLAEAHGATVWLTGRRPLTSEEQASIAEPAQGSVTYLQADLTDASALAAALAAALPDVDRFDGVIHAALVMDDRLVADQTDADIARVMAPKTEGIAALMQALEGVEVASWIAFSSSNAYTANQGQAAYAAASAWLDTAVLATGRSARVIDWGLWGEVGRMAADPRTAGLKRMGIWPIATAEGIDAFERILAGAEPRVLAMKVADTLLTPLGVEAPLPTDPVIAELERMAREDPPAAAFDPSRLAGVDAYAAAAIAERLADAPPLAPVPEMRRLADAIEDLRAAAAATAAAATADEAKRAVEAAGPETAPYMALLDHTLPHVRDVVEGRRPAAEVLFPEGTDRLVRPIYQGNPMIDWLQRLAARAVAAATEAKLAEDPSRTVRVVEVGGGTGGTTVFTLEALRPFGDRVAYTFTDIGPSFLVAARKAFAGALNFEAKLLDASRPAIEQGFTEGSADVVLAANVVHATADIATTTGNLGRLLAEDGVLVLKEATGIHAVNTLTFGLTAEWWGFEDDDVRMPGGPLLSRDGWRDALTAVGYRSVGIAGLPGDADGFGAESVIVAAAPLGARQARAPEAARPKTAGTKVDGAIEETLIAAVAEALHLEPSEIDLAASFADYGADSIISVELVRRINEAFGIELKTTTLFNFATVRDLARYIALEFADSVTAEAGSGAEPETDDAVATRLGAGKARTRRLREMIEKRRTAAPVNAEAEFLAREAEKTRAHGDPDRPGAMSMETLLKRLEAGEIALEEAYETEVTDDA